MGDYLCQCAFCGETMDEEDANELDWCPYFYIGDVLIDQEVCLECSHHVIKGELREYEIAHDFDGMVYRYDFTWHTPVSKTPFTDTFRFVRGEPPQDNIDYIASHRPGCEITHCMERITYKKESV